VGQILNTSHVDAAVLVDKNMPQIKSILVAYAENIHDDLALSLALRMLGNDSSITLKVFRFAPESTEENALSYEFMNMLDICPPDVKSRVEVIYLEDSDPMNTVIEASKEVDLTIAGTSRTWGIERQTLGVYTDKLAKECHSSLLIARRYSPMMSHISSLFNTSNLQTTK
jgi:nucleotide-binding universal stress UspA family protein